MENLGDLPVKWELMNNREVPKNEKASATEPLVLIIVIARVARLFSSRSVKKEGIIRNLGYKQHCLFFASKL